LFLTVSPPAHIALFKLLLSLSLNTISALPQSTIPCMCLLVSLTQEMNHTPSQSVSGPVRLRLSTLFFERWLRLQCSKIQNLGPLRKTYYELSKIAVMVPNGHSVQLSKFRVIIRFLHILYSLPTCLPTPFFLSPPLIPCMSLPRSVVISPMNSRRWHSMSPGSP